MKTHAIIAGIALAAFFAGTALGPAVKEDFDASREARAVYGVKPDESMPWSGEACKEIAVAMTKLAWAKRVGAKKSLVMAEVVTANRDETYGGEIVGEISRAWDKDVLPGRFYIDCMMRAIRAQRESM